MLKLWICSVFTDDTVHGSMVEDFVAVVRGGSSESITALVSKKLPTPQLMRLWGDGVRFNPDFIRTTVSSSFTKSCITSSTCNAVFLWQTLANLTRLLCFFFSCLYLFYVCPSQFALIINLFIRDLTDAEAELKRGKIQPGWSIASWRTNSKRCQITTVPNTTRLPCYNTVKFQDLWGLSTWLHLIRNLNNKKILVFIMMLFLIRLVRYMSLWPPEISPMMLPWRETWREPCQSTWLRLVLVVVLPAATME